MHNIGLVSAFSKRLALLTLLTALALAPIKANACGPLTPLCAVAAGAFVTAVRTVISTCLRSRLMAETCLSTGAAAANYVLWNRSSSPPPRAPAGR